MRLKGYITYLGIVLAALGYITPLIATGVHVVSELAFICNSARLLLGGRKFFDNCCK